MKQRIIISLAVAAVALVAATAALASSTLTATATIGGTAGISLNLPSAPSFSDTLDGTDQTVSYAPVLGVVDARGSGAGWNLTVAATTFSDGSGHTLAAGNVSAVAQACHAGSTCTAATSSGVTYPLTLSTTAAKVFNAAVNSGLGKVDVMAPFHGDGTSGTFHPGEQSQRFPTAPVGILYEGDPGVAPGIANTPYTDFAPRVGFAWDVKLKSFFDLTGRSRFIIDMVPAEPADVKYC